jgi:hypothetical protein
MLLFPKAGSFLGPPLTSGALEEQPDVCLCGRRGKIQGA